MNRDTLTRRYLKQIQRASRGSFTVVEQALDELEREHQGRRFTIDEVTDRIKDIVDQRHRSHDRAGSQFDRIAG